MFDMLGIMLCYFFVYDASGLMAQVSGLKNWTQIDIFFYLFCFWFHHLILVNFQKKNIVFGVFLKKKFGCLDLMSQTTSFQVNSVWLVFYCLGCISITLFQVDTNQFFIFFLIQFCTFIYCFSKVSWFFNKNYLFSFIAFSFIV
jgi:hypothetical protein